MLLWSSFISLSFASQTVKKRHLCFYTFFFYNSVLIQRNQQVFRKFAEKHKSKMGRQNFATFIGISRHRLATDGKGVTTLAAFHGCPLNCHFCLNPQCKTESAILRTYSPESLYAELKIDELYFLATGGGVTFGGGEPLIRNLFISQFRRICGNKWKIAVETSLNVPAQNVKSLIHTIDEWIIDIKDLNPEIYCHYTGTSNNAVIENLKLLADNGKSHCCTIRLPLIPGYNTEADIAKSETTLRKMGFDEFDHFEYRIP